MAKAKSKKITLEEALVPVEEQPYEVPENWCWTYLLNGFAECKDGNRKPINASERAEREGDIPYYGATGQAGWIDDYLTDEQLVLLGEDGAPFLELLKDKAYLIEGKAWVNNHAHIIKSHYGEVGNKYILHYLNVFNFHGYVNGTTRLKLTQASMRTIPVPLPPFAEQKRIVEQIESLFAKLDMAREKAEFVISCFEERMVAIIHKAFEGVLTRKWREENNVSCDSWKMVPLKNCGRWFGGGTPTTSVGAYWEKGDIPWITSKDMKDRVVEDSIMHITMAGVENSSANYCDEPAVLFVMRSGILRRVFPVCMVNRPFTVNQDLKACVPAMNQDYLYWFCNGYEKDIRDKCMKSGTTVESVEAKKLMDYEVPVASANEQTEVVKQIESLINKEESVKELAKNVIEKIDAMKKLILAKAFRGELGTNASSEENSIELLKKTIEEG